MMTPNLKHQYAAYHNEHILLVGSKLANLNVGKNKAYVVQQPILAQQPPIAPPPQQYQNRNHEYQRTNSMNSVYPLNNTSSNSSTTNSNGKDDAQMVDFASSILFPIAFILFNVVYWIFYLNMQVY